jgi:hypothetical protein
MITYSVVLRSEEGEGLDGYVKFYNAAGEELGEAHIGVNGFDIYDSDIPVGTVSYRFVAPGYSWYGTSTLYDANTITLVKEVPIIKYLVLGGAGVVAGYLLIKFLKF